MTVLAALGATDVASTLAQIAGLVFVAGILGAITAVLFRWYARQRVPLGLAVLVGSSAIAALLNTRTALGELIGETAAFSPSLALFNIGAFAAGAFASAAGQRAGDRIAVNVFAEGAETVDGLSRVVQAVGRVITVEFPEVIGDVVGYDPVPEETKAKLAGQTLVFPRRLTVAELRERVIDRLQTDYGVGHVDIELTDTGSVEYLALGDRAAGIGPTLPPGSVAVAIRADPANAASAGDVVQIWSENGEERICNGELRGTAGEIVTIVVDETDADRFDPEARYRIVTLSVDARPDREFASLLRAADETMAVLTVGPASPMAGMPVGALDVAVVAVDPGGGELVTIPPRTRVLTRGDSIYVIATPDALRRVEIAAAAD